MTTTININGTLTLDQTSGIQPDDTAISNDLTGLSTAFKDFLNGLSGDLQLSAGQLAFADNVEAAVSGAGLVTVNPDGATISKLFFSDGSGAPLDGDQVIFNSSPLLTVDGSQPIFLHSYANGTIVLATTSAAEGVGDVVAAFYLNAAGDNLTASVEMVTFQAIAHPDSTNPDDTIDWTNLLNVSATGSTSFNFDNLASGNNLFVAVGTSGAGLVVSGIHPVIQADGTLDNSGDNIKTSQGGIGATIGVNNQMFDPGETAVFSFVKGQAPGTYGDIDNMSYTDFIDVTDAKLFISQTEGSPGTNFTVKIGAFSAGGASTNPEAGRSYIDNNLNSGANLGNDAGQSALADDSSVAIVRVIIRDGNGVVVTDTTATNGFVTFNGDGTITAQHLNDAYTVQWFTDNSGTQAVETFNRFQATAVVGKFDVGRVDLSQGVTVTQSVGDKLHTNDDGPTAGLTENTAKVLHDETAGVDASSNDQTLISLPAAFAALGTAIGWAASASAVVTPNSTFGTDGPGTQTLSLGVSGANADSGFDSLDHHNILLNVEGGGLVVGRVDVGNDGNTTGDPIAIAISINASGILSIAQYIAIAHPDGTNPDDVTTMLDSALLAKLHTVDGDGDTSDTSIAIGDKVQIRDDGPTITHPFDGDPDTAGIQNETLANTAGATASGTFGYNIGADAHPTAFYTGGGSDFSPITLTGTVSGVNPAPTALLTSDVTLASETLTSATFNFTFTYDKDPAAGPQTGTAGGTLVFDKVAHTYTINLTDPLEGFSFDIIHTSQFLSKVPTSNTGHPPIVLEKLQADDPNTLNVNENFYVQFTGNLVNKANPFGLTSNGEGSSTDTSFNTPTGTHDMISNANETWVSATQSTNGVAGDTIQKGELLTLRFFNSDVGIQNEATAPTATASAMAIKFDGIGNSEDLMLILDLLDKGADNIAGTADDGPAITRAMYVENTDIFRIGQVPAPYNSEFTLDNNDGLVVIEQNDYNAASEHYALQGVQIMQSGNGITGNAINLNTTGSNGGASSTTTLVSFDGSDNDVLKITDIGFTSTVTTTPDANLDFAFQVADADADQTAIQHILVDVV